MISDPNRPRPNSSNRSPRQLPACFAAFQRSHFSRRCPAAAEPGPKTDHHFEAPFSRGGDPPCPFPLHSAFLISAVGFFVPRVQRNPPFFRPTDQGTLIRPDLALNPVGDGSVLAPGWAVVRSLMFLLFFFFTPPPLRPRPGNPFFSPISYLSIRNTSPFLPFFPLFLTRSPSSSLPSSSFFFFRRTNPASLQTVPYPGRKLLFGLAFLPPPQQGRYPDFLGTS